MSRVTVHNQAWVTLATNDSYAVGALVLGHSLRRSGTLRKKVIMITMTVSQAMQDQLRKVFDEVVDVAELDSGDFANLELLERPELGITFTKLHCWKLLHFAKCVFLDADTLVLRNCDELFDRDEFSAAPDAGWPDCFNSGVFVFQPSLETYKALLAHAQTQGSFDGGDQGLLNTFFSDWPTKDISKHLSFLYNMCATATYTYLPAYRFYGKNVRIIHFIGASKPWHVQFDPQGQPQPRTGEEHTADHLKQWWQIYFADVKPSLAVGLQKLVPSQSFSGARHAPAAPQTEARAEGPAGAEASMEDRRESWEEGRPDYMGRASFDNILKKISSTMSSPVASPFSSQLDLRASSLPNLDQQTHYWHTTEVWSAQPMHDRSQSHQDLSDHRPFEAEPPPDPWQENKTQWERGYPDYLGMNAFDNIKARLDVFVQDQHEQDHPKEEEAKQVDNGYHTAQSEPSPDISQEQQQSFLPPLPADDRSSWEVGHPDYLGKASFDNILRRIEANLGPVSRPATSKLKTGLPVKESAGKKKKTQSKEKAVKKKEVVEVDVEARKVASTDANFGMSTAPRSLVGSIGTFFLFRFMTKKAIKITCPCCGFDQEVPKERIMNYMSNVF